MYSYHVTKIDPPWPSLGGEDKSKIQYEKGKKGEKRMTEERH
jgi:hypothetical protein